MSKLEHIIDEIEDYLDGCKFQALSKSSIIVDKKILDAKLRELRNLIPDEFKKYQTIINNKETILQHAREQAHTLIDEATNKRNELIDGNEVMKQAYEQAGEVVKRAAEQAGDLLDQAQTEANGMKEAAVRYTDALLANVEKTLQASIDSTNAHMNDLLDDFNSYRDTVKKNRSQLSQPLRESEKENDKETEQVQDIQTTQSSGGYSAGYVHAKSKEMRDRLAKEKEAAALLGEEDFAEESVAESGVNEEDKPFEFRNHQEKKRSISDHTEQDASV